MKEEVKRISDNKIKNCNKEKAFGNNTTTYTTSRTCNRRKRKFEEKLQKLVSQYIVVMGDLNAHVGTEK